MDLFVQRHRRAEALCCAYNAADDRRDFRRVLLLGPRMRAAYALAAETPPGSDQGFALTLRDLAAATGADARASGGRTSWAISRTAARVAGGVARGAHTGRDLAELRALLPAAERIDEEIRAGAVRTIEHALAWLARPKLVRCE